MRTPFLWVALVLTLLPLQGAVAQTMPSFDAIFDDFTYETCDDLFDDADWHVDLGDLDDTISERAWYYGNWRDSDHISLCARNNYINRISTDGITHLRIRTLDGEQYGYPDSSFSNVVAPPVLMSGFMAQTGTWVARVRLRDLRTITDTTLGTQSFWTISPYYASSDTSYDHLAWSEIDQEWNNWFSRPVGYDTLSIMMSSGHTVDGQPIPLQGGYWMRNNLSLSGDLTCWKQVVTSTSYITNPGNCIGAFISNYHNNDWNRFADLMVRYDGSTMTYGAAMWNYATSPDPELYYMERSIGVGRTFQPMTTMFSQIPAPPQYCARQSIDLPQSYCTTNETTDMYVDWFLYTPSTNISIWDAIGAAWYFGAEELYNVNTTGLRLARPAVRDTQALRLRSPLGAPTGGLPEWVVYPPVNDSTLNSGTSYHVVWETRVLTSSLGTWSSWQITQPGGFTLTPSGHPDLEYKREVKVTVSFWHLWQGGSVMEECLALHSYGTVEAPCEVDPGDPERAAAAVGTPLIFGLAQNEPNPAGGPVRIAFTLPVTTTAHLVVYDVVGREVAVLVNGEVEGGHHQVTFDASVLRAGVYAYVLTTPTDRAMRRLTVR